MQQLSAIDSTFVLMEQPRTPFHVTMVNIYDPSTCPGTPPTFDDIVEAVTMVSLHTDIADPLERLAAIAEETRAKKAVQKGVVMPVLLEAVRNLPGALLGVAMRALPLAAASAASSIPITNTMVTNVPGPAVPYYLLGAKCVHVTGSMPLMDGGAVLHAVCSYNGEFVFTFTACRDLLPDSDFYRDCLSASVQEVVAIAAS